MNVVNVTRLATLGGGCFWCTQAVFSQLRGVASSRCGFSGGALPDPTYHQVCAGATGHAEVVQLVYDPAEISYRDLLEVFFQTHDPTTLDKQGHDIGSQYRSVIFYHDVVQRELARTAIDQLQQSGIFSSPIVTQLLPFKVFYVAEEEHQDYFAKHPTQPYCVSTVRAKVEKCREYFAEQLRS